MNGDRVRAETDVLSHLLALLRCVLLRSTVDAWRRIGPVFACPGSHCNVMESGFGRPVTTCRYFKARLLADASPVRYRE